LKWAFLKWGILGNYFLKWGILGVGGGVRHEKWAFMKWGILGVRHEMGAFRSGLS